MRTGSTYQPAHLGNWSWPSLYAHEEAQVYNRNHPRRISLNLYGYFCEYIYRIVCSSLIYAYDLADQDIYCFVVWA